jgi:hypothetical protein
VATDQVLAMLRRWVQKIVNEASREVDAARLKVEDQLQQFAITVKAVATQESPSHDDMRNELCMLVDRILDPHAPRRRSRIRQCLILKRHYARDLLTRNRRLNGIR